MFNLCSLGPRGQKLRSAELSCGGPEGTTKHQHWGAPALSHPQPQGTGARSRARDTSPDAFDISRMAGTEAAAGPSGRCSPHSKVLSFVSCPVQPQGQRGRLAAVLSHKLVSLRRALRRSQEGTQELGAGAWGTWRERERGRGSQRGRDGGTGQAQRASSTLQDKKLELQERLRELQHRTRSLLRQRLETLEQLRVLLREEEATASHQLQKAVEKRWSRRPRLRSATSPSPSTSPGLRQHSPGSPRLLHHIQRCLQELQVDKTHRTGSLEHPEVLGGELGTAASEEEWGQPGTRDSPPVTASPKQKRFLVADTPRPSRRKHDCRSRRLL
eukprot:XP_027325988.1 uncharacterized protein LOC110353943 isoform X4 [Anas platyrhynchos]